MTQEAGLQYNRLVLGTLPMDDNFTLIILPICLIEGTVVDKSDVKL